MPRRLPSLIRRTRPLLLALTALAASLGSAPGRAQTWQVDTRVGLAQVRSPQGGAPQAWRTLALQASHSDWQASLSVPACLASPSGPGPGRPPACGLDATGTRRAPQSRQLELRWALPWTGPLGMQATVTATAWHAPASPGRASEHGSSHAWELAWPVAEGWELWLGRSAPLARNEDSAWRSTLAGLAWTHANGLEMSLDWDDARHTLSSEPDRELSLRLAWHDGPTRRWRLRALRQLDQPLQAWALQAGLDWRF